MVIAFFLRKRGNCCSPFSLPLENMNAIACNIKKEHNNSLLSTHTNKSKNNNREIVEKE